MRALSLITLFLGLCAAIPLWGFEPVRTISVVGLAYEHPVEGVLVQQGNRAVPLELNAYAVGAPVSVNVQGNVLRFVRAAAAGSEPAWLPVGEVEVPAGAESVLLVFVPNAAPRGSAGESFRVLAFGNDVASFPAGSVRTINLSPFSVGMRMGQQDVMLSPAQSVVMAPAFDRKNRVHTRFAALLDSAAGWSEFFRGPFILRSPQRATCLVVYSVTAPAAQGMELERGADGTAQPSLMLVTWEDYIRPQP